MTRPGRLLIRLTTQCNSACSHCTIADIDHFPDKPKDVAWKEIAEARQRGCTELVFMRGEPTLRRDLSALVRRARKIGYRLIQLQTNGRLLSYIDYARKLVLAGTTTFEVSFFGHNAKLHDAIDGSEGAFDQVSAGLRNVLQLGAQVMVTVPIVKRNVTKLSEIVRTLHRIGVPQVQFNFSRPVKVGEAWNTGPLVRLGEASMHIRAAIRLARSLGVNTDTEAVPLCHLDEDCRQGAEVAQDFGRYQVDDLHRSDRSRAEYRSVSRPIAPECTGCQYIAQCPTTWAAYQSLFGTWELRAIEA